MSKEKVESVTAEEAAMYTMPPSLEGNERTKVIEEKRAESRKARIGEAAFAAEQKSLKKGDARRESVISGADLASNEQREKDAQKTRKSFAKELTELQKSDAEQVKAAEERRDAARAVEVEKTT